jgi:CheY-like chemotaxis protein
VIADVLHTIDPLSESLDVPIEYTAEEGLPLIRLQAPILRQALLNLLNIAIGHSPRRIDIHTSARPGQVLINIDALPDLAPPSRTPAQNADSLDMTKQLVQLCSGALRVSAGLGAGSLHKAFSAQIALDAEEQITVLVIDDNRDVLQLFQRYLSGSRYRFAGASSAQQGLTRATAWAGENTQDRGLRPEIVVLDVMMPEQDGWTLLGQLREHPRTRDVPIIVCTILPQEQLALTLGADEFLRKPVSRSELLSALDRQADTRAPEAAAPAS